MASFQLYQDELVSCPYNAAHRLKKSRMQIHLAKCKKEHEEQELKVCPFNAQHRIPPSEFKYHLSVCPDRDLVEKQVAYESTYHQGNTTVPAYKVDQVQVEEFWDDVPSVQPGYIPVKKGIKGKPAERKQQYKAMFAGIEGYTVEDEVPNGKTKTKNTPASEEKPVAEPKPPMRLPKSQPIVGLSPNVEAVGLGRAGPPAIRRKIAANIFGGAAQNQIPVSAMGLGRGQGLGRGHPPLNPGQVKYLND